MSVYSLLANCDFEIPEVTWETVVPESVEDTARTKIADYFREWNIGFNKPSVFVRYEPKNVIKWFFRLYDENTVYPTETEGRVVINDGISQCEYKPVELRDYLTDARSVYLTFMLGVFKNGTCVIGRENGSTMMGRITS